MKPNEHFLVVDLEATCDDRGAVPRSESEIIEIGAVLARADTLEPVAEFQRFVCPVRHPALTPFCTALTSITQADVDSAKAFPEVLDALAAFLAEVDFSFCSWGDYDRTQLEQDARFHGVALPLGAEHWNVKRAFAERAGEKPAGVGQALARVGLRFQGTAHRGIDDARNILRLVPYALGRLPIPPKRAPSSGT